MANIKKIKLPNGTEYDIKDSGALPLTGGTVTGPVIFQDATSMDEVTIGDLVVNGSASFTNGVRADTYNGGHPIYFIKGTQTASTNIWTGNLPSGVTYYNGLTIDYLLPYAGTNSAATLNLSELGAKPVYYGNSATGGVTTHYGANTVIHLTYVIDSAFNSGNGCWKASNYYDSNTVSQLRWDYSTVYAGTAGIFPYTLIMMNSSGNYESIVTSSSTGTSKARNTVGFVPGTLLVYYASGTTTNGNKISASNYGVYQAYTAVDFRYSANISSSALTVGKPVYLIGTITNGLFYLDSTWWTQTLPASDDGKVYMYVGDTYNIASASTEYRVNVTAYHPMYWYKNGALRQYGSDANTINGLTVQTAVPSGAKFTDTITTATTTGSGNAVTSITASNGALTVTKGTTFLTSSDISGKIDTAGTGLSKSGTTLNHSNSITAQTTQALYPIKIDAQGHISAYGTAVTSLPASDVYSWAKASTKPTYTASEVGAATSNHTHSVTITPTTTEIHSMTSAGSVTAGTANVPTVIDTSKFSGGSFTRGTFSGGSFTQGTDSFTQNTPTVINTSKFSGGSFTRGTFSQGTLPTLTMAMDTTDTKKLKITFGQGTLPTHAADSFTAAAFQSGFYTAGTKATFTQGTDSFTAATHAADSFTAAKLNSGFYTAGTANTPTAVTLPGRGSAVNAWTGYSSATANANT